MCFFGNKAAASTPAAAPDQPSPAATDSQIGSGRKAEDAALYGGSAPSNRVSRSMTSGGIATGTGLRM